MPDEKLWEPLPREALTAGEHAGRSLRRVCLTTDAGLGKSYNLRALEYELCEPSADGLAFRLLVGDLCPAANLLETVLLDELRAAPGNDRLDGQRLLQGLRQLQAAGQITLLLDGLDQTAHTHHLNALVTLADPAGNWANCRIVVAGRPFVVQQHWDRLFAAHLSDWRFVQIGELDEDQQRGLLSDDRYDAIPRDARPILTVPRVLEFARGIPPDQLSSLRTVSDVYWQATRYMLGQALGPNVNVLVRDRYQALLGALAFTMYARTSADPKTGTGRPNLDRIACHDMPDFLLDARDRLVASVRGYTEARFDADLAELSRFNSVVFNHGWLDMNTVGGPGEDLIWRNASLQEFFAAYWVSRWGEADAAALRDWVWDANSESNRAFYWLWRYAAEMPDDVIWPATKPPTPRKPPARAWVAAMTHLYVPPSDKNGLPIRSTEMLYRSWDRLGDPMAGTEPQRRFLAEFQGILAGERGPDAQHLAQEMVADVVFDDGGRPVSGGFVPLVGSGLPDDTGTFWMGSAESDEQAHGDERTRHRVTLSPFRVHRFCVTNAEYELFDSRHKQERWLRDKPHPLTKDNGPTADDRCPVVNVSWYDAWCFAAWCECRLPTEAEWEYACRAGTESPYSFGETLSPAQAQFDQDWSNGHTVPVDARPANPWHLHQTHGNVWEWRKDWYDYEYYTFVQNQRPDGSRDLSGPAGGSIRVDRGGSWSNSARRCRPADRDRCSPEDRSFGLGFRLRRSPSDRTGEPAVDR